METITVSADIVYFECPTSAVTEKTLSIKNNTDTPLAFKMKLTNPKRYCVKPSSDVLGPHEDKEVKFLLQPVAALPVEEKEKTDKFQILATAVDSALYERVWRSADKSAMAEVKFEKDQCFEKRIKAVLTAVGSAQVTSSPPSEPKADVPQLQPAFISQLVPPAPVVESKPVVTPQPEHPRETLAPAVVLAPPPTHAQTMPRKEEKVLEPVPVPSDLPIRRGELDAKPATPMQFEQQEQTPSPPAQVSPQAKTELKVTPPPTAEPVEKKPSPALDHEPITRYDRPSVPTAAPAQPERRKTSPDVSSPAPVDIVPATAPAHTEANPLVSELSAKLDKLTEMVSSLTHENTQLASTVSALKTSVSALATTRATPAPVPQAGQSKDKEELAAQISSLKLLVFVVMAMLGVILARIML